MLERDLIPVSRVAVAALVARAARRVAPVIATAVPVYGNEAWEWLNAIDATIRTVDAFARAEPVSRFTLDLASELSRAAATATAAAARGVGHSPLIEPLELAYATAAFAADAVRAATPERAAILGFQCCRAAEAAIPEMSRLIALDAATLPGLSDVRSVDPSDRGPLGELWPLGEPTGWATTWEQFAIVAKQMPQLLALRER